LKALNEFRIFFCVWQVAAKKPSRDLGHLGFFQKQ